MIAMYKVDFLEEKVEVLKKKLLMQEQRLGSLETQLITQQQSITLQDQRIQRLEGLLKDIQQGLVMQHSDSVAYFETFNQK